MTSVAAVAKCSTSAQSRRNASLSLKCSTGVAVRLLHLRGPISVMLLAAISTCSPAPVAAKDSAVFRGFYFLSSPAVRGGRDSGVGNRLCRYPNLPPPVKPRPWGRAGKVAR